MFTDFLNLSLDRDRLFQTDQVLSLSNLDWSDYETLTSQDYLPYRVSYFQGVITIVSPSRNHERIADIINGLIRTYCRKYNLAYFALGSTTLKNPPLAGKEPDCSFAFGEDKAFPDLAIEVIYSSGNISDLEKYRALGIKEVWLWQDNQIIFYQLLDSGYQEIAESVNLKNLSATFLIKFINRGLDETPLTIESDFYQQLV